MIEKTVKEMMHTLRAEVERLRADLAEQTLRGNHHEERATEYATELERVKLERDLLMYEFDGYKTLLGGLEKDRDEYRKKVVSLRAEVERLKWERDAAEVAYSREQESIKVLRSENCGLGQERDWLRAEVERLRADCNTLAANYSAQEKRAKAADAENERLRALLREWVGRPCPAERDGCDCVRCRSRAALGEVQP